jgi:hypothetical protein
MVPGSDAVADGAEGLVERKMFEILSYEMIPFKSYVNQKHAQCAGSNSNKSCRTIEGACEKQKRACIEGPKIRGIENAAKLVK